MFCPQCGVESSTDLKFCRSCGANLKVIGKAVSLSEAIARSDSVPAKIKDMVKNLKIEKVTDEVARAMEKMNQEIARDRKSTRLNSSHDQISYAVFCLKKKKNTVTRCRLERVENP